MINDFEELKEAVERLQTAVEELRATGFDERWIVMILRDKTGVGMNDIRNILYQLENLRETMFPLRDEDEPV